MDRIGRTSCQMLFLISLAVSAAVLGAVDGLPSGGSYPPTFTFDDEAWFDSWGYNRNYYGGSNGYMPNLAYETLGANQELAYGLGLQFRIDYPSEIRRAEAILRFVQRWTEYGYDEDNVVMDGQAQYEWAWNADEMAHMFNVSTTTIAVGDCEDMAFLCATIYLGSGIDAALVLTTTHVALLIWLPDYPNANYYWDLPDDGKESGWIWVEATGDRNPLGWTPPDFADGDWVVFPLGFIEFTVDYTPRNPQAEDAVLVSATVASARGSVDSVVLNYSVQGNEHSKLTMTGRDSVYEATIPRQPKGTRVTFSVSATDTEGNVKQTSDFQYTVGFALEIPSILLEPMVLGLIVVILLIVISFAILSRGHGRNFQGAQNHFRVAARIFSRLARAFFAETVRKPFQSFSSLSQGNCSQCPQFSTCFSAPHALTSHTAQ